MRRSFYILIAIIIVFLGACAPIETSTSLSEYSSISFLNYKNVTSEVSYFEFTGIDRLDLGEMDIHGILFTELTFVANEQFSKGCSIFLSTPPLLFCPSSIFAPGTVAQMQFLLHDNVIWEGEIVIP